MPTVTRNTIRYKILFYPVYPCVPVVDVGQDRQGFLFKMSWWVGPLNQVRSRTVKIDVPKERPKGSGAKVLK